MNVLATWLIACALNVWAESKPGGDSPADLKDGWVVSGPGEQGLNPDLLQAIGPRFEAWKEANAHAILVARHGVLVYERYFAGEDERLGEPIGRIAYDATMRHDVRSITKSVTSLLVGMAIDRGWIKDLDASVFSLLPKYADLRTPDKDRITLRHLLTMSAGFAWNEELPYSNPENSERLMIEAPDPIRHVLEQPLAATPGQIYRYSGGATALLAAVLQETSGKPLDVLAREVLFDPLDITDVEWMRYGNGEAMAASGLRLRPRDLAKIGQLVLAGGSWGSKRIVSTSWIKESTTPKINGAGLFFYGYQWWLGRSLVDRRELNWVAGFGWGGQRLFIVPDADIVVVVMAGLYNIPHLQGAVGGTVLNEYVLPAVIGER